MITLIHRWFSKPLARHLREPRGILGRLTAHLMNSTNEAMVTTTIDSLGILPQQQVLDIGFGGGASLEYSLSKVLQGHVSGLEVSLTMLNRAKKNYREFIVREKLSIHEGVIESLPFGDNLFDRICTVNTLYFWHDTKRACAELYRVCQPNGIIALSFRTKDVMRNMKFSQYNFKLYHASEVISYLQDAGFQKISVKNYDTDELGFICLTAHK